jgi:hypothetical protein
MVTHCLSFSSPSECLEGWSVNCSWQQLNFWPTVSWPVRLGVRPLFGVDDQILNFSLSDNYLLLHVRHPLWWEDRSVVCSANTHWSESRRAHDHILPSHLRLHQPGGPSSCIYIPQKQGGPVIPLSTGLPFYRLLQLTGLWWRYSNPSPQGKLLASKSKLYYDQQSVGQSVLVPGTRLGHATNFFPFSLWLLFRQFWVS